MLAATLADPDALVLAAKGGHNAEMHNHNDVGTFIVQVAQEALVCDIGCGHYTLQVFGEKRYDLLATSSLGQAAVPVVNGQLQAPGREFTARLLEHTAGEVDGSGEPQDLLRLELSGVYPLEADLERLERRVVLHRTKFPPTPLDKGGEKELLPLGKGGKGVGWVEVEDRFAFKSGAGSFESALTTFGKVVVEAGVVWLEGERGRLGVRYPVEGVGVRVRTTRMSIFPMG